MTKTKTPCIDSAFLQVLGMQLHTALEDHAGEVVHFALSVCIDGRDDGQTITNVPSIKCVAMLLEATGAMWRMSVEENGGEAEAMAATGVGPLQ